jgi:hypothetical protein
MSAELDQLDALMRQTFNCSFDDFMRQLIKCFDKLLEEARAKSYCEGVSDGLQAKSPKRKRRGHPSTMDPGLQLYMALEVDENRKKRMTVKQAVDRFLRGMRQAHEARKAAGGPVGELKLPTEPEAVRIYHRTKKKGKTQQLSLLVGRQWSEDALRSRSKRQEETS